ncbi:hypothetical protein [Halobacteriovorax sp. CON-3]|uniref:hypothetical protein n=1 Tax=Halobacteriovorax sp. CON-3 TaxID=3157710 RepID=UPI0037101F15
MGAKYKNRITLDGVCVSEVRRIKVPSGADFHSFYLHTVEEEKTDGRKMYHDLIFQINVPRSIAQRFRAIIPLIKVGIDLQIKGKLRAREKFYANGLIAYPLSLKVESIEIVGSNYGYNPDIVEKVSNIIDRNDAVTQSYNKRLPSQQTKEENDPSRNYKNRSDNTPRRPPAQSFNEVGSQSNFNENQKRLWDSLEGGVTNEQQ